MRAEIRFSLAASGTAHVTVYDVAGRKVREGRHALPWDGRDDAGESIGSGVYFVRIKSRTEILACKAFRN